MGGADAVAGHVIAIGSALAGLVLVFIGINVAAFDGYDREHQNAVRPMFRRRLGVSFAGFVLALVAVGLALGADWSQQLCLAMYAVGTLSLSTVAIVIAAGLVVADVFK